MEDALRNAYALSGQELPKEHGNIDPVNQQQDDKNQKVARQKGRTIPVTFGNVEPHRRKKQNRNQHTCVKKTQSLSEISGNKRKQSGVVAAPVPASSTKPPLQQPRAKQAISRAWVLDVKKGERPVCLLGDEPDWYAYSCPSKSGIKEQAHTGNWSDERDVVIGLDFGTSSTKVIIADRALTKAFAVPFGSSDGIQRFLLPSRLYQSDDVFSLSEGKAAHRDLKLALLANHSDEETQVRVVAFLALVVRHARGWLLSIHRDIYLQTNILWKLAVGLPTAHHLQSDQQALFQSIALAAWLVAGTNKIEISRDSVLAGMSRAKQLDTGQLPTRPTEEAEISIIPEIAAQIYGFVASNRFDRNAKNVYLMVDIGAGTVDSSLFHVEHARGGKKKFTFFTSQVQPNGVMNLHRSRIQWWIEQLSKLNAEYLPIISRLENVKLSTDRLSSIPESYRAYFSGVSVNDQDNDVGPDGVFFRKRVVAQVRGNTMWRAWNDDMLTQQDLMGVPMFLCGGGARMEYYREIEQEISRLQGCTWLKVEARSLDVPKSLIAPGLPLHEYDRLSVAFGLSFLEVGTVLKATPIEKNAPEPTIDRSDNYIDKDQC